MMLANEKVPIPMTIHGVSDYAWLAGAKAGLVQRTHEIPDWPWLHFLDGVQTMVCALQGLKPLEPGDEPEEGSIYNSLGGYVSVTGQRTEAGIMFPVPRRRAAGLASMFPGIDMVWTAGHLVVQGESVEAFGRLVPLRGPIVEEVAW
jgi:hypothetical protein